MKFSFSLMYPLTNEYLWFSCHNLQFSNYFLGTGRVEPVPITLKNDRQGLGRTAALQELAERKKALRERKRQQQTEETITPEQFRARMTQRATQKYIDIDLRKSQKMCRQFDEEQVRI